MIKVVVELDNISDAKKIFNGIRDSGGDLKIKCDLTPAQQSGWSVGDYGVVNSECTFDKGSVVYLKYDDGSEIPFFGLVAGSCENVDSDGSLSAHAYLASVDHVGPPIDGGE